MFENIFPIDARPWGGRLPGISLYLLLRQHIPLFIALGLAGGYAYLLAWFNRVDFYHNDFFVHGSAVTAYQIARLIFIPYFAWTVYCAGAFANFLVVGRAATATLLAWERYPLCFITGAAIWHIAMFGIGLAGYDIKPVALALSLGTMALSVPHLADCVQASAQGFSRARFRNDINYSLVTLLWLGIIVVCSIFLLVKGIYPGGGHDYYNHYFQFYKRVIETGSILPNDVWYQFYYSKGAGLYFLAMLLTDPLAPQLVTMGFIGCGAAVVYALLRTATRSSLMPLIGILLYVGVFLYTPGPAVSTAAEWGFLEKIHELTAVLLLGIIWIAYRTFRNDSAASGIWILALHFAIICVALLTLPLTLLVGLYFAGYVAWFAVRRQWRMIGRPFAAGVTVAFCIAIVAAINYHYTGFPSIEMIVQFWPHADFEKVNQWGTMFEILNQYNGAKARLAGATPISWKTLPLVATFLRFELWWPLFVAAAPFVIYQLRNTHARTTLRARFDAPASSALVWFGATVILAGVFGGGRDQPQSFYRFSSFSYAPTLCFALMLCHLGLAAERSTQKRGLSLVLILGGMLTAGVGAITILSAGTISVVRQNLTAILVNAGSLLKGQFSLKDAYQNQQGHQAMPWGAIYPGIIEPWRIAGPRTRIWSFHIHSYCMLPDCNIQEFVSEKFSPSWQTVFSGNPNDAVKALQAEGLNYFFFSSELAMYDPLPQTPLFSPNTIAKYLAIRWTDGTSYLLSWPSANTKPIDRKFLAAYINAVAGRTTANHSGSH